MGFDLDKKINLITKLINISDKCIVIWKEMSKTNVFFYFILLEKGIKTVRNGKWRIVDRQFTKQLYTGHGFRLRQTYCDLERNEQNK